MAICEVSFRGRTTRSPSRILCTKAHSCPATLLRLPAFSSGSASFTALAMCRFSVAFARDGTLRKPRMAKPPRWRFLRPHRVRPPGRDTPCLLESLLVSHVAAGDRNAEPMSARVSGRSPAELTGGALTRHAWLHGPCSASPPDPHAVRKGGQEGVGRPPFFHPAASVFDGQSGNLGVNPGAGFVYEANGVTPLKGRSLVTGRHLGSANIGSRIAHAPALPVAGKRASVRRRYRRLTTISCPRSCGRSTPCRLRRIRNSAGSFV